MADNQIKVFENNEFGTVRTTVIDGEPWFVGKDVALILKYTNPQKAIRDHVDEEDRTVNESFTVNGTPIVLISESGLYSLIMCSKLPTAKAFKRWVTNEVLPDIRKHGMYMTKDLLSQLMDDPRAMGEVLIAYADEKERNAKLEQEKALLTQENEIMKPKATYYDAILASPNSVTITQIAKDYGMSAIKFNQLLHDIGIQYKASDGQWLLYQKYATEGYTQSMTSYDTKGNAHMHTRWTQKGRLFLYDMLKEKDVLPARDEAV